MEKNIYDVDYFIKKFEAIPEKKWIIHAQYHLGSHCALGHCMEPAQQLIMSNSFFGNYCGPVVWGDETEEGRGLTRLFSFDTLCGASTVANINNGLNDRYPQPTPKQRILAALYDIKAKQQPEVKERIVYVTVDAKVRELQKLESLC